MITASKISIADVTPDQIGKCRKIYEGSTPVWMVESESIDAEYKVRHSIEHGFTCTCKAGQNGFSKCSQGVCKHVRWALAAAKELREAIAELEQAIAEQAVKPVVTTVDAETLARVEAACESSEKVSKAKPYQPKAFSLLR